MKSSLLFALLLAAIATPSGAQKPDSGSLAQERARIEAERKEMFAPDNPALKPKKNGMPSAERLTREQARIEAERKTIFADPSLSGAPNVFPNIPTPAPGQVDIEALAKRYESKAIARKSDDLMIFASFSMPAESLRRLVASAHRVGGAVVLRGFKNNSYKDTAKAIHDLGEQGGNVLVNPNAFDKYKVSAVPTVVLTKPDAIDQLDADGCALPNTYAAVSGDVTLDYALDELARRAPEFEPLASRYLRQLRGR
jgi:conjugal transfer pilus assembly protein TrbC